MRYPMPRISESLIPFCGTKNLNQFLIDVILMSLAKQGHWTHKQEVEKALAINLADFKRPGFNATTLNRH